MLEEWTNGVYLGLFAAGSKLLPTDSKGYFGRPIRSNFAVKIAVRSTANVSKRGRRSSLSQEPHRYTLETRSHLDNGPDAYQIPPTSVAPALLQLQADLGTEKRLDVF